MFCYNGVSFKSFKSGSPLPDETLDMLLFEFKGFNSPCVRCSRSSTERSSTSEGGCDDFFGNGAKSSAFGLTALSCILEMGSETECL